MDNTPQPPKTQAPRRKEKIGGIALLVFFVVVTLATIFAGILP